MNKSVFPKSIASVTLTVVAATLFAVAPAQAVPPSDCTVSASFSGDCLVQPGVTVSGLIKGGNGGAGGNGGNGGNAGVGVVLGGLGGIGGIGGAGAKTSYSFTNTTSVAVTLTFAVGFNGNPGTAGTNGSNGNPTIILGLDGGNGFAGTGGVPTDVQADGVSIAMAIGANGGTGGTGGTGGGGGLSEDEPGVAGTNGVAGADAPFGTLTTTWTEAPFASIDSVEVATPGGSSAGELAATGTDSKSLLFAGVLGSLFLAIGSTVLVARRRIAGKR